MHPANLDYPANPILSPAAAGGAVTTAAEATVNIKPRSLRESLCLPNEQHQRGALQLRNRYIATRFTRFAEPGASLSNTNEVMNWARQLLDDDQLRLALELLHLALQENPQQPKLWLFLLEQSFLKSDVVQFAELADLFLERFAGQEIVAATQPIIDAMGHDMAPNDPRYAHVRHKGEKFMLPNWSIPDSMDRDEKRQQALHRALVEAMMSHVSR